MHLKRGIQRPLRMVLMRHRRTEQCEDAVAGRLHHVTLVVADRFDHDAQRRVDDRTRVFGVEILHQFGRALDIGEQRSDRLAFALERG
jgi:hypothetical protein